MQYIANVSTLAGYDPTLTIAPSNYEALSYAIWNNTCAVQFFRLGASGGFQDGDWSDEIFISPSSGNVTRCGGIRFRTNPNTPTTPGLINAWAWKAGEPQISGGQQLTGTLSASGAFTSGAVTPTGGILIWTTAAVPSGFVLCDGTHYDGTSATYLALWQAIGNVYGGASQGDFAVPDLRGRLAVGLGTHTDVAALGNNDGAALGSRRPKHTTSVTDPGHLHSGLIATRNNVAAGGSFTARADVLGTENGNVVSATTGITAGPQVNAPTDAPAYIVLNYVIKL
jgi:microcystin-dependent protein